MKKILKTWREYLTEEKTKEFKAAMVVVFNDKDETLILKRSLGPHWMPGKWALPGGHIEEGETPLEAAVRETKEETNLEIDQVKELGKREQVMIYYTASYSGDVEIDFEHTDWAWISSDKLTNYDITPDLKDNIEWALKKKGQENPDEM